MVSVGKNLYPPPAHHSIVWSVRGRNWCSRRRVCPLLCACPRRHRDSWSAFYSEPARVLPRGQRRHHGSTLQILTLTFGLLFSAICHHACLLLRRVGRRRGAECSSSSALTAARRPWWNVCRRFRPRPLRRVFGYWSRGCGRRRAWRSAGRGVKLHYTLWDRMVRSPCCCSVPRCSAAVAGATICAAAGICC